MPEPNLTPKQLRFCEEYVIDRCATKALIRAGFSKRTAASKASQLLDLPQIQEKIKALQHEIAERNKLTADMIIDELRALAFYNVKDFVTVTHGIVNLKKAKRDLTKCITGIKVTERFVGHGEESERIVTTEIKFADKRAALVDLGKTVGIFEKDNNQKKDKIIVRMK